ncbi:3838_t:CDS:1 [Paraglomus occultum]|uniref:3838_t:CDS:1 n=1 Tax=Paraglomus occultum TaxID=144539 RepID=A0A9N9A464_9GLOM|nr:3838_t:CDS:1 [Paraglomus occultum]
MSDSPSNSLHSNAAQSQQDQVPRAMMHTFMIQGAKMVECDQQLVPSKSPSSALTQPLTPNNSLRTQTTPRNSLTRYSPVKHNQPEHNSLTEHTPTKHNSPTKGSPARQSPARQSPAKHSPMAELPPSNFDVTLAVKTGVLTMEDVLDKGSPFQQQQNEIRKRKRDSIDKDKPTRERLSVNIEDIENTTPTSPLSGKQMKRTRTTPSPKIKSPGSIRRGKYLPSNLSTHQDPKKKPGFSYASLIGQAILQSPTRRLTLAEIYEWIAKTYPYYRVAGPGWQNSIRHNLSLNKSFVRIEKPSSEPGKGSHWTIKSGEEDRFIGGTYRQRKNGMRGRSQGNQEADSQELETHDSLNEDELAALAGLDMVSDMFSEGNSEVGLETSLDLRPDQVNALWKKLANAAKNNKSSDNDISAAVDSYDEHDLFPFDLDIIEEPNDEQIVFEDLCAQLEQNIQEQNDTNVDDMNGAFTPTNTNELELGSLDSLWDQYFSNNDKSQADDSDVIPFDLTADLAPEEVNALWDQYFAICEETDNNRTINTVNIERQNEQDKVEGQNTVTGPLQEGTSQGECGPLRTDDDTLWLQYLSLASFSDSLSPVICSLLPLI